MNPVRAHVCVCINKHLLKKVISRKYFGLDLGSWNTNY